MYFENPLGDIYYHISGQGFPLILIHGFSLDYRCLFYPLEPIFSDFPIQRIYIDLPGMGHSQNHKNIKNADQLLALLSHLIDFLVPEGDLSFAGYSYGGYLTRCLLSLYGERCRGYHGNCPVIIPDKKKRKLPAQPLDFYEEILPDNISREEKELFFDSTQIRTVKNWNLFSESILPGLKTANRHFLRKYKRKGYESKKYDSSLNPKHDFPHFLFLGEQDYITGTEDALDYYKNLENGRVVISEGTGHLSYLEAENLYQKYLRLWIEEILSFI